MMREEYYKKIIYELINLIDEGVYIVDQEGKGIFYNHTMADLEKVIKAGFRIVVSRSAVTAGAVALARRENITMLGFMRKNAGNIYHIGQVSLR